MVEPLKKDTPTEEIPLDKNGIPTDGKMRAVIMDKFGDTLRVERIPIPKPASGQVLVKVEAAAINPSDLAFIMGKYTDKIKPPIHVGFEGSGTVVENGGGIMGWSIKGKRVAIVGGPENSGTWAEFAVVGADKCVTLGRNTSFEQGACFFVNPLTVIAFEDIISKNKHRAVIQTAAASQLGRMLNRVLAKKKVPVINIVRREEQRATLKAEGAEYILNSSDENFEKELKELAHKLNATVAFDAVGGDLTYKVVRNMPISSTVYVYGVLSQSNLTDVDPGDMIGRNQTIKGFLLSYWLEEKGKVELLRIIMRLQSEINTDFKSEINKEFKLEEANEACKYYWENMSKGKNVIKPWLK